MHVTEVSVALVTKIFEVGIVFNLSGDFFHDLAFVVAMMGEDGGEVALAKRGSTPSVFGKDAGDRGEAFIEEDAVVIKVLMGFCVTSGEEVIAGGHADRVGGVGIFKEAAFVDDPIHVWGFHPWIPCGGDGVVALLVDEDDEKIWFSHAAFPVNKSSEPFAKPSVLKRRLFVIGYLLFV